MKPVISPFFSSARRICWLPLQPRSPTGGKRPPRPRYAGRSTRPPSAVPASPRREALPIDLFTSKNFYKTSPWSDPATTAAIRPPIVESMWERAYRRQAADLASWATAASTTAGKDRQPYPTRRQGALRGLLAAPSKAPHRLHQGHHARLDGYYDRTAGDRHPGFRARTGRPPATRIDSGACMGGIDRCRHPFVLTGIPEALVQMLYHEASTTQAVERPVLLSGSFIRWWPGPRRSEFQLTMTPYQVQSCRRRRQFLRQSWCQTHSQKVRQCTRNRRFWTAYADRLDREHPADPAHHVRDQRQDGRETFKPAYDAAQVRRPMKRRVLYPERCAPCATTTASCGSPRQCPQKRFTFIECLSNIHNRERRPKQLTDVDPQFIISTDGPGQVWRSTSSGWTAGNQQYPGRRLDS